MSDCRCHPSSRCGRCCVMCNVPRTIILTRPRPVGRSEYQICVPCAVQVKREQETR